MWLNADERPPSAGVSGRDGTSRTASTEGIEYELWQQGPILLVGQSALSRSLEVLELFDRRMFHRDHHDRWYYFVGGSLVSQ